MIGRSEIFKYNNQDHTIVTGMYTAINIVKDNFYANMGKIDSEGIYVESDIINYLTLFINFSILSKLKLYFLKVLVKAYTACIVFICLPDKVAKL